MTRTRFRLALTTLPLAAAMLLLFPGCPQDILGPGDSADPKEWVVDATVMTTPGFARHETTRVNFICMKAYPWMGVEWSSQPVPALGVDNVAAAERPLHYGMYDATLDRLLVPGDTARAWVQFNEKVLLSAPLTAGAMPVVSGIHADTVRADDLTLRVHDTGLFGELALVMRQTRAGGDGFQTIRSTMAAGDSLRIALPTGRDTLDIYLSGSATDPPTLLHTVTALDTTYSIRQSFAYEKHAVLIRSQ